MNSSVISDEDRTIIYGDPGEAKLSPDELRALLELPQGDDIKDYSGLSAIGMGGLGAVFSAQEPGLNREVALKVLRPEFRNQLRHIESFIREARTTAQIDHPNIVPVHRIGIFRDVGVYFTMRRIEGETLRSVIRKLAENQADYQRRYSLQRRMEIFISICQGVAFAHRRGIIHRDLKPGNIMLGDYGEVLILDWGLATYRREKDQSVNGRKMALELDGALTSETPPAEPRGPLISGTPAYMAPEQAAARNDEIDERTDVYCLGAILYSMLTLEPAPYDSSKPTESLLRDVVSGRLVRPRRRAPLLGIPRELEAVTLKAMARRRDDRYPDVQSLIREVRNYLDKYPVEAYSPSWVYRLLKLCVRRPLVPVTLLAALLSVGGVYLVNRISEHIQTSSLIQVARYNVSQADAYYNLALRTSRQLQHDTGLGSPAAGKRRMELDNEFSRQTTEFFSYCSAVMESLSAIEYRGAGSDVVRHEMVGMLSDIMLRQIKFCIATENDRMLRSLLRQLNSRWKGILPELFRQNGELAELVRRVEADESILRLNLPDNVRAYLRRDVATSPAGEVEKWEPVAPDALLDHLPSGSYLVRIEAPERPPVYFPVILTPAGETSVEVSTIPEIPDGMVLVPGGEFHNNAAGGAGLARKMTLPAFLIDRNEVTFGQYLEFWKQLRSPEEKAACMGRFTDSERKSYDLWDADGRLLPPFREDLPVVGITGAAAEAYCRYLSRKTGRTYRLPTILEWEKAGRGADARSYVWGDEFRKDAALLCEHPQRAAYPVGAPPGTFPLDRSGYGVEDLAGNVREFVRNPDTEGRIYSVMGGSYLTGATQARCWSIGSSGDSENDIGFRCVAELPKNAQPVERSELETLLEDEED